MANGINVEYHVFAIADLFIKLQMMIFDDRRAKNETPIET